MTQISAVIDPEFSAAPAKAERWAWWICWLMFVSTVLCYMDRQVIALVKEPLKNEFQIANDETFGWIIAAFMMTYALFQIPAGYLADSGNVRRLYALAVGGWSLAGFAAAYSPTLGILIACRVMLGVGESFNWPCALKVTSRILPPADRGLGNGIFNSGAAVGAVLTPLTIPYLATTYGWRSAFAVIGGMGFVWVVVWLSIRPRDGGRLAALPEPRISSGALSGLARAAFSGIVALAILTGLTGFYFGPYAIWSGIAVLMIGALIVALLLPESHLAGRAWSASLGRIVRLRRFWVMTVVAISINVCWHFLVYWMADFFQQQRKMGYLQGGMISALPFLAADAGNLLGGWIPRQLTRGGLSVMRARTTVMAAAVAMIACGSTVGVIRDTTSVVAVMTVMATGVAMFMANYFALCQEVSLQHTGLIVGVLGGLGNLFAAGFQPIAGKIKDVTLGAGTNFAIVGLLPILGFVVLMIGWGRETTKPQSS